MREVKIGANGIWPKRFYECGPLVLDGMKDQASVYGADLALTAEEYSSLYLLAQRESQILTFEQLYKAVWEPLDDTDRREAARAGMDNVVKRLNAAGRGALRIDILPEDGFVLRLEKWGVRKSD